MTELCHCGKALHYTDKAVEKVMHKFVAELGRYVSVVSHIDNKTYKVDRHYIALHGLIGKELHNMGFEEVNDE